jgi:hypothetical protein
MPQRKWRTRGHYTIAYPSTAEAQRMIEEAVMAEYRKVAAEPGGSTGGKTALTVPANSVEKPPVDPDGAGSSGARREIVCLGYADYKTAS